MLYNHRTESKKSEENSQSQLKGVKAENNDLQKEVANLQKVYKEKEEVRENWMLNKHCMIQWGILATCMFNTIITVVVSASEAQSGGGQDERKVRNLLQILMNQPLFYDLILKISFTKTHNIQCTALTVATKNTLV